MKATDSAVSAYSKRPLFRFADRSILFFQRARRSVNMNPIGNSADAFTSFLFSDAIKERREDVVRRRRLGRVGVFSETEPKEPLRRPTGIVVFTRTNWYVGPRPDDT